VSGCEILAKNFADGQEELVRGCYEWEISNLKSGSWAKKLKEELDKTGLVYIWQDPQENSMSRTCKKLRRCNDIESQNMLQIREQR
jgi:hypothetical protein